MTNKLILIKNFNDDEYTWYNVDRFIKYETYECKGQFLTFKNKSYSLELYWINDGVETHLYPKYIIDEHFISEVEYRKHKLKKINKIQCQDQE